VTGTDQSTPVGRPKRSPLATTAFVVGYIATAWFVYFLWCRFQFVESRPSDYVVLAVVAFAIPILVVVSHVQKEPVTVAQYIMRAPTRGTFFGGVVLTALIGGAVIRTVNALLDPSSGQTFPTVITHASCGRAASLSLRGAPSLPATGNAMSLNLFVLSMTCEHARLGDTVVVSLKPGLFGRSWIASYEIAHDSTRRSQ